MPGRKLDQYGQLGSNAAATCVPIAASRSTVDATRGCRRHLWALLYSFIYFNVKI